ncbi:MAG: YidC/Oxa1 family insertase periplasmic-domain containing protein [Gemmatimonadota bacterium]|nr:YidC/Oxa1 family insertase periplasmic-domain containing protein [Gemmatimonadota bacterium]
MDRRVFLAVILTAIVIVVTPLIFPGSRPTPIRDSLAADSITATVQEKPIAAQAPTAHAAQKGPDRAATVMPDTTATDSSEVASGHMTVWYADRLGAPSRVKLDDYQSRNPGRRSGPVDLRPDEHGPLLSYALAFGDSTASLAQAGLVPVGQSQNKTKGITFQGMLGSRAVRIAYAGPETDADRYLVHVVVNITDAPGDARLLIDLPRTLASAESDTLDDFRHLAFGYKPKGDGVQSIAFGKLDSGQTKIVNGPLEWVALRNKYFLVAVISQDSAIAGASFTGGRREAKVAVQGSSQVVIPLRNGQASFDLYTGPQEFERLQALGHDLAHVNPYAGWLHGVVQPFANIVTRVLLWMKRTSGLSYGWVIIIFGVTVRLLLWPLNQSAMRTSIRMQRLQPELAEVQRKYKNDPEKQRDALVKLYQAHGMTPFSPMMGCLPMLIPMPILFALYFVFLNTIEFRGVPFLWMHDISAADPYFITPLVMGLSMFALSWIGMRGTPPTPQTRMMSYMMPVVFTFMFLRFAAGLNLYYAVQNLAALPQQWLLARERASVNASGISAKRDDRRDKT